VTALVSPRRAGQRENVAPVPRAASGSALRTSQRHPSRRAPVALACASGDDGGHDGDRQSARDRGLVVRPGAHDGRRPRERVRGGGVDVHLAALVEVALVAVRDHPRRQRIARLLILGRAARSGRARDVTTRIAGSALRAPAPYRARHVPDTVASTATVLGILLSCSGTSSGRGRQRLSLDFFTHLPTPVGEPGAGWPIAARRQRQAAARRRRRGGAGRLSRGVYLAEYDGGPWRSRCAIAADVLNGIPSIRDRITVYGLSSCRSATSPRSPEGSALGLLMIPSAAHHGGILRLVPDTLRDASLGSARRSG